MSSVRLGPFEIHETVGSGGMGVVRRGIYHGPSGEVDVAVKFVQPPVGTHGGFREAFVREVQSAARLHHPNIVSVYDIGEVPPDVAPSLEVESGTSFLVMEYVPGGTLESHVGRLSWTDLRSVLLHLLDALAHAHALGIVHRDLKPANVLCRVTDGGMWPMLTDFGIARAMDVEPSEPEDDEEPQRVAGTPYYMAPEHVMGRWRDEGPWTDVYALGALGWHLVTGMVPFAGDTGDVLRAHLMSDLPEFAPTLDAPDGFEAWLRRLLDKDLTRRYRRAADAAWALMQFPETLDDAAESRPTSALVISDPGPTLQGLTTSMRAPETVEEHADDAVVRVRKHGLAPPIPDDWRRGNGENVSTLRGTGLGLLGLRPVPIVGRDAERSLLWDGLRAVHATSRPHGTIVSGAVGTGKSRLVSWLSERSDEVGGTITLRATHATPMTYTDGLVAMMTKFTRSAGLGFESVLMRVRALYNDLDLRGDDALFDAVALTERILGLDPENAAGPRFQSRPEWFAALLRVLGGLSQERPVLLWLDDVQCSHESLDFACFILAGEDEQTYPVYVVMTVPDEIDDERAEAKLDQITDFANVSRLELDPLDAREVGELTQALGLSPRLGDLVMERTDGNPLFAVQLVEDWVSRGALQIDEEGFAAPAEDQAASAEDIDATWRRRVEDVLGRQEDPETAAIVLRLAATLGTDVDASEWKRAAAAYGIALPRTLLAAIVGAGLATRHETGWTFVHSMLRESILRTIDAEEPRYHRACAAALEEIRAERRRPRTTSRLAEHLVRAGEPGRAFDVLIAAVLARRETEEHAALLRLTSRAEELLRDYDLDVDDVQLGTLHANQASIYRNLGDVDAAKAQIETGIAALAGHRPLSDFARNPDDERNPLLADLLTEQAIVYFESEGDLHHADELLARAQELSKSVADPLAMGWSSKIRSRILCTLGRVDEGVEAARQAVDAYAQIKRERPDYYFSGLHELAGALRTRGDLEEARAVLERADRWIDQIGSREALALAAMERAELARALEDYDAARQHYRTSSQMFEMLGGKNLQLVELNLCLVDVEAGDLTRPLPQLRKLRDALPTLGMESFRSHSELAVAACAARVQDWDDFDTNFSAAAERLRAASIRDPELAGLAIICARECDARGESVRSRQAAELARDLGGAPNQPARASELARLLD